mgnify:FL=1
MAITYHAGRRIQGTSSDQTVPNANRGTIDTSSSAGNTIITFTGDGTFTPTSSFDVQYLVVAGGGGGGIGGGAGAGGFRTATGFGITAQNYAITVGAGGDGFGSGHSSEPGDSGVDSSFGTITSTGGGGGGYADQDGANGGSGSGSGGNSQSGTARYGGISSPVTSPVQGYAGGGWGSHYGNPYASAGGGGSSAVGQDRQSTSSSGSGGAGTANPIVGSTAGISGYLAGGGGGGSHVGGAGTGSGGSGGGGSGSSGGAGSNATGYGSGGGGGNAGGNGSQGIVIIKFATSGNTYDTGTPSALLGSTNVQVGSRFEETDTRKMYHRVPQEEWVQEGYGISGRGVFAGGLSPAYPNGSRQNSMEYITIGTLGNGTDFGDLTSAKAYLAGAGNDTRGLFAGGDNGSAINNIDQFTFMTLGNCTDFGDLSSVRTYFNGTSNNTYGVFAGGNNSKTTIDYVTIATPSNSTGYTGFTFDRTSAVGYDSPTKAFFSSGGGTNTYNNIIETVVFGTWGTVADFGDLTLGRDYASGCSSTTRGIVAGGFTTANSYAPVNNIDYTTMDTPSNAIDFGDLSSPRYELDSVSNGTRGVFYSGVTTGDAHTNIIDYITIDTLGNATDFGDALITRDSFAGCSNK